MKVKIKARLECAPAAEGKTLVVKNTARAMANFQQATGWKLQDIQAQIQEADVLGSTISVFFALANAGFVPDWDELLDTEIEAFEVIPEPGDDRSAADAPDPRQLPVDSSPVDDGDGAHRPDLG